jgi:monomeric isocitrate dehydrogenase
MLSSNGVEPASFKIRQLTQFGKLNTKLQAGEVIDASTMSVKDLCDFYEREITDAKESDILLSLVSTRLFRIPGLCVNDIF